MSKAKSELPYHKRAERYARRVVSGEIAACDTVRLACERHLGDLKRVKEPDYPYYFDPEAADAPCAFGELLPHVKGQWAKRGELIVLGDWQCFILCVLFGWLRKSNDKRRFRIAYLCIPRKNGKSVLAAIIGLYMFCMDGEFGAEVYSGATTEKQAWEVFRPARMMLVATPKLVGATGAEVWAKSLVIPSDHSRFEPVVGKPGDGSSPNCAIADEFHEHDSPDQVDTMITGMGAREQPLMLEITTAGNNLTGPCFDMHNEAVRMLNRVAANDELFAIIYSINEKDDWTKPEALYKANPNIGVSVDADFLLAQQRQAVINPINQNRFRTKHLNVWCSAKIAWMPLTLWQLCGDPGMTAEDLRGQAGVSVLDLASKDDIAVEGMLFHKRLNDQDHYYWFGKFYLPERALEDGISPNASMYRKWHKQGFLQITEGAEIDFDVIKDSVLKSSSTFQIEEVLYDPWRATQLAHQLQAEGATIIEIRQTVQNLSLPMKEVLSAVQAGRLHHDGNPVMTWMMSNVTAKEDAKDNIYPRKEKRHMKIDGPVALIMAMARSMTVDSDDGVDGWLNRNGDGADQREEQAA